MPTSNPMPLRLHFIRHGETEWSRSGQYPGCTDIALTAPDNQSAAMIGAGIFALTGQGRSWRASG